MSAARFDGDRLTLSSAVVGVYRYSNAVLHMDANQVFTLAPVADPVTIKKSSYENKIAAAGPSPKALPSGYNISVPQ